MSENNTLKFYKTHYKRENMQYDLYFIEPNTDFIDIGLHIRLIKTK